MHCNFCSVCLIGIMIIVRLTVKLNWENQVDVQSFFADGFIVKPGMKFRWAMEHNCDSCSNRGDQRWYRVENKSCVKADHGR